MSKEVIEVVEKYGDQVVQFQKANDERLAEIEKKGFASADIEKKVNEMSLGLSDIEEKQTQIMTAMNRLGTDGTPKSESEEKAMQMKSAVIDYLHTGNETELKELSVGSDPNGGYTVFPEIGEMIQAFESEVRPFMGLVNVENISSASWTAPADYSNAVTSYYAGELDTRNETDTPVFGDKEISVTEQYAQPYLTTQIAEDSSYDIEGFLLRKIRENMTEGTSLKMHTGATLKGPRGFLTYTDGTAGWEEIEQIFSGSTTGFTSDKIIDLQSSLKDAYQANASFLARRASIAELRKLKSPVATSGGQEYLIIPDFANAAKLTMLGQPLIADPDMPAIGSGSLSLAYGDFKRGYTYVNRRDVAVLRNPFKVMGKVVYEVTRRNGGDVTNFEAIKLMDCATS